MKYNRSSRVISEHKDYIRNSFFSSPTLIRASGVATIAGAAISGANAMLLTFLVLSLLMAIGLTTILDGDRLEYPVKPVVYTAVSVCTLFCLLIIIKQIFPNQINNMGVYAPLLAFNSLVLCRSEEDAPMLLSTETVSDALALAAIFALVAFPVAITREILGSGEIFGLSLGFEGNTAFNLPFFGFILSGFCIALIRNVMSRFDREGENT